ncbi:MAG: class B sortase [Lachnospiraceae bacterium]|nr:class B sortase [Lachnospiraceae bacterium]
MAQKIYIVEGRQFRNETDYNRARHDKELIDRLRIQMNKCSIEQLKQLQREIHNGKYKFLTLIGQDFEEEIEEEIQVRLKNKETPKHKAASKSRIKENNAKEAQEMDAYVKAELAKREKRRRLTIVFCGLTALICLGYFGAYSYFDYKTRNTYKELSALKEKPPVLIEKPETVSYTKEGEKEIPEVLDEYKNLIKKNKKLIGWVKIDDTNIDYPVMQTVDNEYYLDHNLNQEYDKNGSIFMDKDCDVLKPSTNFILYGHHMKSGKMFGNLHLYSSKEYWREHQYIEFDTIYEKGVYQIMYVFRSRVYSEEEIVFKYYQFIDALSETEFNSNMQEMAALSLYDTGVTAEYGDQLLTLSTCDYEEKDGRFVVVAKKVTKE